MRCIALGESLPLLLFTRIGRSQVCWMLLHGVPILCLPRSTSGTCTLNMKVFTRSVRSWQQVSRLGSSHLSLLCAGGEGVLAVCPVCCAALKFFSSIYSDLPYRYCRELSDRFYVLLLFFLVFILFYSCVVFCVFLMLFVQACCCCCC